MLINIGFTKLIKRFVFAKYFLYVFYKNSPISSIKELWDYFYKKTYEKYFANTKRFNNFVKPILINIKTATL